jgi:hypothetical protein
VAELWPGGPIELPHDFLIDDEAMTLPATPVPKLLHWLGTGNWAALFPLSVDPHAVEPVLRRFVDHDGDLDYEHLYDAATLLWGHLAGTASADGSQGGWWPAMRLAATALHSWPAYCAWCAAHGTDPLGGPLWRVVTSIYGWLQSNVPDGRGAADLERDIWAPPPEPRGPAAAAAVPSAAVREQEAAMALASLGQLMPGEDPDAEWAP